jgi:hypothetical protein
MSAFNVLRPNHFMLGIDFHDAIVIPPTKLPWMPHPVFAPLEGYVGASSVRRAPTVRAETVEVLKRKTDIGQFIPHTFLNLLLPAILLGSASKSYFGANTVRVEGTGVAVATMKTTGINLNCGTVPLPTGVVMAPGTVRAGMTLGDALAGLAEMLAEGAIQGFMDKMLGITEIAGPIVPVLLGYLLGSPLGYSVPWAPGGEISIQLEKGHDAVAEYFNDPSRRQYL